MCVEVTARPRPQSRNGRVVCAGGKVGGGALTGSDERPPRMPWAESAQGPLDTKDRHFVLVSSLLAHACVGGWRPLISLNMVSGSGGRCGAGSAGTASGSAVHLQTRT